MAQAVFDIAEKLDLYFRVARDGSKTFTFTSGGLSYDVSGITWQLNIKVPGASDNTLQLTSGSGLTISTNTITVAVTAAQTTISERLYYWELYDATNKKTWLCGNAHFTSKDPADLSDSTSVTVYTNPDTVAIAVSNSGGSTTLGGLSDVTITSAASGDILTYNGTGWVNTNVIDGGTL